MNCSLCTNEAVKAGRLSLCEECWRAEIMAFYIACMAFRQGRVNRIQWMSVSIDVIHRDETRTPIALIDELGMNTNFMDGIEINEFPTPCEPCVVIDLDKLPGSVRKVMLS